MNHRTMPVTHKGADLGTVLIPVFEDVQEAIGELGGERVLMYINRSHTQYKREEYVRLSLAKQVKEAVQKLKETSPEQAAQVEQALGIKEQD